MPRVPRQPLSLADCALKQICADHNNLEKLLTVIEDLNITYTAKQQIRKVADFYQQFQFILPKTQVHSCLHIKDGVVKADLTFLNLYRKKLISCYKLHLSMIVCGNEQLFNATKHARRLQGDRELQRQEGELKTVSDAIKQLELLHNRPEMTNCLINLTLSLKQFMDYGWLDGVRFLLKVIRKRKDDHEAQTFQTVINIIFGKAGTKGKKWLRVMALEAGDLVMDLVWRSTNFYLMKPYFEALGRRELERHIEMLKAKAEEPKVEKKLEDLERFLAER
ncbi:hypothetical protein L596_017063 [Steinernema carpocapsae]|uniref:Uncharacterized protein n=1 Tax=Steinernema carpocapsae TaxID=34508 RepID=A0A4U5N0D4_STECR|nr:hypothetical protein L596_017063 [Steinernema carpocapsae]